MKPSPSTQVGEGYPLGETPVGIVQIDATRLTGVLCGDRTPGGGQRLFLAYSGTYQFDGHILTTVADSASSPDMLCAQRREVIFTSSIQMMIRPLNAILGAPAGGGMRLTWERVG